MRDRRRLFKFILVVQLILFLAHFFLYETWLAASGVQVSHGSLSLALSTLGLSISFVSASLLAFRYTNAIVRAFYTAAATWLGLFSFLFLGAVAAWIIAGISTIAGLALNFHGIVQVCLSGEFAQGMARA
jgi:hypothetical protein